MRKRNQDSENRKALEVINDLYTFLLNDTARAASKKAECLSNSDYTMNGFYGGMISECEIIFDRLNRMKAELEKAT